MLQSDDQDHPNEDVSHDAAGQVVAVDRDSPIPEQRCQSPGIGARDGRQVHKGRQTAVTPVGDELVDEVGDEDDLGTPEVVAGPQQDPGEDEEVVQDEVGGYVGGGGNQGRVLGEEVPDIAKLGEEQDDPESVSLGSIQQIYRGSDSDFEVGLPVNASHSGILAERSVVLIRLLPDLLAVLHIVRRVDRIVNANDDHKGPGKRYEDPIGSQRVSIMGFTPGEGVVEGHDASKQARCYCRGRIIGRESLKSGGERFIQTGSIPAVVVNIIILIKL